jgi:hypothetical protein
MNGDGCGRSGGIGAWRLGSNPHPLLADQLDGKAGDREGGDGPLGLHGCHLSLDPHEDLRGYYLYLRLILHDEDERGRTSPGF